MADKNKTVTGMPPTLLVGLGGTGCEIVGSVYDLANDEQKKYLQFVFLDTDANELRERKFKAPMAHTVQTSRKITVGQALRDDPEAYNNTFPINPQLMNKPLTEGAGQIRAVSKLAFDMCIREGRLGELHDAINELQKLNADNMEQAVRVLVVSTLVGGTGSGLILPVCMYLRDYLENTCGKKPIIRAFCVLPEVFFNDPFKTEVEKNNLRTNAYATLRELDAFMLRADSKPDADIRKRFTLKMPRPGTVDQYEEYQQNPLDYCFLFDAQNIDGKTLNDLEDYKRHAADCIYASFISRLHKRLNSSEDNTILERCAENGRNRYCGAGTSKLVYPFKGVRDYVALNWMSQAMTSDWLRYDDKVTDAKIKRQKRRAKGIVQPPVNEREFYCTCVESDYDQKNYFGFAITEECYSLDKSGTMFTKPKWESFYDNLVDSILEKADESVDTAYIDTNLTQMRSLLAAKNSISFKHDFQNVVQMMKMLYLKTKKMAESKAAIIADGFFSLDNYDVFNENRLEYWLQSNGVPMHPNSIRYFLYKLEAKLKEKLAYYDTPVQDDAADSGDDQGAQDAGEDTGMYDDRLIDLLPKSLPEVETSISRFFNDKSHSLEVKGGQTIDVTIEKYVRSLDRKGILTYGTNVISECEDHVTNIVDYYKTFLVREVVSAALAFIDSLCKNYEFFYERLAVEIKKLSYRIDRTKDNYRNSPGNPVMYICSSDTCLDAMLNDCPNIIDPIELTEEFRRSLFGSLYKTADADSEIRTKHQTEAVKKIVSEDIIDFWRKAVIDQYGHKVDLDIIDAILREAEYEEGIIDVRDQEYYVETKYLQAKTLSAPFIELPPAQPYKISAVAMSNKIVDEEDLVKCAVIKKIGRIEFDSLMDKYQMLVMTCIYNLKASDLHKFASQDDHPADPREDGSYFSRYVSRIDNVLPDPEKSNVITPHLDRRWHFVGVLPDFEDETEEIRIKQAHRAFLAALAYEYIRFDRDRYKFVDHNGDFISEQIVVSDNICDRLHEVYEALSISRPLVRSFNGRFDDNTGIEKKDNGIGNVDFTESQLYQALRGLKLARYNIPVVSYLEIPFLYKISIGNGSFNDDDAIKMLHNFIDVTDEYLSVFYDDKIRRNEYMVRWLDEQAELFFSNVMNLYSVPDPNNKNRPIIQDPTNETLFRRIANNIIGRFERLKDECDAAADCYTKYKGLCEKNGISVKG